MAKARAPTPYYAPVIALAAALIVVVVAAPFFVVEAADAAVTTTSGEPDPADAARVDNRSIVLDCTMRCVTEAMGCATRCGGAGAGADEAPVCAAACVQADIGCLTGCGLPLPQPAPQAPPPPAE